MTDTDLLKLLPSSISQDVAMVSAGQAAGDQEEAVRALIPNIHIWSRIEELPEPILDHLGWALHIDGWEYATTIELKRWLVKNFHDWHRFKGTAYGLELYWRVLLGRKLLKAEPPGKSFLGASLTEAERQAFEAPHPEIRIYPFATAGQKHSLFVGDCLGDPAAGKAVFAARTDAMERCGSRVELYDPQLDESTLLHDLLYERETAERLAQDVVEIRKPGKAVGLFAGRPLRGAVVDHGAKERLFTLKLERPYQEEIERRIPLSIQPGLEPMSAYYRTVAQPGQARGMFAANRWPDQYPDTGGKAFAGSAFPGKSDAAQRIYKCFKLFDPDRVVHRPRKASLFAGAFRIGPLPPHTAEVAVDMAGQRPPKGLHLPGFVGRAVPYVSDAAARIARMRHVGNMARRLSDKVLVSITNRKPVRASAGIKAGDVRAGEYRLEVI